MPKFNVYLLTTAGVWKGIEAAKSDAAIDKVIDDEPLDAVLKSDEQWRLVAEEVDEEDEEIEE